MKKLLFRSIATILFLLTISTAYAADTAFYKFSDNVNDQTGNYNGITGGVTYSADFPIFNTTSITGTAKAGEFDGSDYVKFSSNPYSANTDSYTLVAYIKADSLASNGFIIGNADGRLRVRDGDSIQWAYYDGDTNGYITYNSAVTGTYYQVAIVVDNGVGHTLYIDGIQAGNNTKTTSIGTGYVSIGARTTDNTAFANYFDGRIDEVHIYDSALTPTNITNLFNCNDASSNNCTPAGTTTFKLTAKNYYTNESINNFTANINGTEYNTTNGTIVTNINQSNNHTINIEVAGNKYFNRTYTAYNTSANLNAPITPWTEIYSQNGADNTTINNFTATYNSINYSTTTGSTQIPLFNISNQNVSISTNGAYNDESTLLNATPRLRNYTFTVYPDPSSVQIYLYDQSTGIRINENITLVVSGTGSSNTYNILTGQQFIGNLTAGTYSFKFTGTNYTTQTYTLSIGTYTYQILNAFLATNTSAVTFTTVDFDSNAELEGATMLQQRLINNTWTTVSSKQTDITGRAQFQYVTNVQYRFITTLTNYTTKTFELDPVIFESYTVRLNREVTQTDDTNYAGIIWSINPTSYTNGNYNLSVSIISPSGALESYGFTANYPGDGPKSAYGSSAYGSTLTTPISITTTGYQQTINITFWYDTTSTDNRTYIRSYLINHNSTDGTWAQIPNTDYGLTTFEKALLAMMAIILVGGFAFTFAGALGGGLISLFMMGWMYYLGFLTLWMILPSILVAVVIIFWRSSTT